MCESEDFLRHGKYLLFCEELTIFLRQYTHLHFSPKSTIRTTKNIIRKIAQFNLLQADGFKIMLASLAKCYKKKFQIDKI